MVISLHLLLVEYRLCIDLNVFQEGVMDRLSWEGLID